jgi:hypothetical protein
MDYMVFMPMEDREAFFPTKEGYWLMVNQVQLDHATDKVDVTGKWPYPYTSMRL